MVPTTGFKPVTYDLEDRFSIQLRYAGIENLKRYGGMNYTYRHTDPMSGVLSLN
jgi:hypothetical protein